MLPKGKYKFKVIDGPRGNGPPFDPGPCMIRVEVSRGKKTYVARANYRTCKLDGRYNIDEEREHLLRVSYFEPSVPTLDGPSMDVYQQCDNGEFTMIGSIDLLIVEKDNGKVINT